MGHLLVVDFDWFFPNPMESGDTDREDWYFYDWGHSEAPLMLSNAVWTTRASTFMANGLPLPPVVPPAGGWSAFWDRFRFEPGASAGYADSNAYAGTLMVDEDDPYDGFESVLLFDAHHDLGYNVKDAATLAARGSFSCEDWGAHLIARDGCALEVRYPQWKPSGPEEPIPAGIEATRVVDDGQPVTDRAFRYVFICRSGGWVPPWCDKDFLAFVAACPLPTFQIDDLDLDREFDLGTAEQVAQVHRAAMERFEAANAEEQRD